MVGCEKQRDDIYNFAKEEFSKTKEYEKYPESHLERKVEDVSIRLNRYGHDTKFSRNL